MRSRWLSTFTILGILLIVLGVVGKVMALTGHRFVYDPGQIPDGNESWYYLTVGALMMLNGLLSPLLPAEEAQADRNAAAKPSPSRRAEARPIVATGADKPGGNA